LIDEVIVVGDNEAVAMARRLAWEEGILGGLSAGANLVAARQVATQLLPGKAVVPLIPHTGLRYLSTDLFDELDWP
jgi:cysteine synthase A